MNIWVKVEALEIDNVSPGEYVNKKMKAKFRTGQVPRCKGWVGNKGIHSPRIRERTERIKEFSQGKYEEITRCCL